MTAKLRRRVLKRPEERRREFLDSARSLFLEKGYEKTSVDDLVDRTDLSKGAFYHHFRSKHDLLLDLVDQMVGDEIGGVGEIVDDPALGALARLQGVLARFHSAGLGREWPDSALALLRLQRENGVLYERVTEASYRLIGPILAEIIDAGAREGVFDPVDASMTAELILRMDFARTRFVAKAIELAKAGQLTEGIKLLDERSRAEEALFNRALGVAQGGISLPDRGAIRELLSRAT